MSRSVIIGVIVLMSISLLGVVGLQLYWITDAIKVKEEQFDRSVHDALAKVVAKLETQEAASVVSGQMASLQDSLPDVPASTVTAPPAAPKVPAAPLPEKLPTAPPATPAPAGKERTFAALPSATRVTASPLTVALPANLTLADSLLHVKVQKALDEQQKAFVATRQTLSALPQVLKLSERDSGMLVLQNNKTRSINKTTDRVVRYVTSHTKRANYSLDTLRYLAGRLDSFRIVRGTDRLAHLHVEPENIKSIYVKPDTIVIYEKTQADVVRGRNIAPFNFEGQQINVMQRERQAAVASPKTAPQPQPRQLPRTTVRIPKAATGTSERPVAEKVEVTKVAAKKDKLNEVVKQMVVEYIVKDVPLKERLNLHQLNELLKAELANQGIPLDFGYWVVSGKNDTVATQLTQQANFTPVPNYKVSLFPNDIYAKSDYLSVYIPDSRSFAIKSLWTMLLLSSIFTLIIILTFGTTIYIIFRQKKLSEMKNDFINNMTHEFKTPIATISLATDAVANPRIYENPDKIRYYNNIIKEENKRMNAQVENVLQIALLEKNEFKMNLQPVDVHVLVTRAVERIKLQVEQRAGQITAQLNALHHELRSDEVHLYNAICNLLDNANKYSPTSPDIRLYTQDVTGGILIAVEDKGLGMSKDTQQRVFEKFYRVPTGNLHNVKGFGLGLSYVKAIVQAHRGNIRLRSELGKGSRFEIFLPLSES